MHKLIFLFSFLSISLITQAQSNAGGKTSKLFYAEAGGPGVLFSANFDSRFKPDTRVGLGFRAGLGFTIVDQTTVTQTGTGYPNYNYRTRSIVTVPLGINYLFGKPTSPNIFEVGVGFTVLSKKASILSYNDYKERGLLGHFEFMYRRQPVDGGFSWRIGFTPIINTDGDVFPFPAVGLGYSFK